MNNIYSSKFTKFLLPYGSIIINILIGFFFTPFVINTLGLNVYGSYISLISIISIFSFLEFGVSTSFTKFYSLNITKKFVCDSKLRMFFLLLTITISLIFFGATILFLLMNNIIAQFLLLDNLILIILIQIAIIILNFFVNVVNSILTANGMYHISKQNSLINDVFSHLLMILLFYFYKNPVVLGFSTLFSIIFIHSYFILRNYKLYTFSKISLSEFLSLTKIIFTFNLIQFLLSLFDKYFYQTLIIFSAFNGLFDFSTVYSLSFSLLSYVILFGSQISNIYFSQVASMNIKDFNKILIKTSTLQFIFLYMILIGFLLFGNTFIKIWVGDSFNSLYFIFLFLFSSKIFSVSKNLINSFLIINNLLLFKSIINFSTLVSSLIIFYFFFNNEAILFNAIIISLLTFFFQTIVMDFYYFRKKINVLKTYINQFKIFIITSPVILIFLSLNYLLNNITFYNEVLFGLFFVLSYLFLVISFRRFIFG